jgi:hypothetical protein
MITVNNDVIVGGENQQQSSTTTGRALNELASVNATGSLANVTSPFFQAFDMYIVDPGTYPF